MDASLTLSTPEAQPLTAPPGDERLPALDLLRGIAILGILPANIPFFAGSIDFFGSRTLEEQPAEYAVVALTLFVIDGKFITLLSILFGAGLAIQTDRAHAVGRPFVGYYLWRMALLLVIGLAHGLLLWYGDILSVYAMVGFVAVFASRLGQRGVAWFVTGCFTWSYGVLLVLALVAAFVMPRAPDRVKDPKLKATAPTSQEQLPLEARRAKEFGLAIEAYFTPGNQTRIYREGSFGELVLNRAIFVGFTLLVIPFVPGWYLLGCFLLGAYLLRRGLFRDAAADRPLVRRLLLLGLTVGVPVQAAAVTLYLLDPDGIVSVLVSLFGALPLALAYLGLGLLWSQSGWVEWLQRLLRAVGRMALSNYLLQSVLCTTIFYGYGLARYGELDRLECLGIVALVWLVNLTISPIWLHFFQMGPVEWLWRSLADRRVRPFLRRATVAA